MKNIFKFIYNRQDNGIYRIRTIFGIRIITKPKELQYKQYKKIEIIKNKNYIEKKYKLAIFLRFGIGDYILFRKFLPYIREYYKDYNITLIGNYAHKDIVENFDMDYIDEYMPYQEYNIYPENLKYVFQNVEYDILISHFYGRTWDIDNIISYINAREKISSYGSLWHNVKYNRARGFTLYNKLIFNHIDEDDKTHETIINTDFFEQLLNTKINLKDMNVELDKDFFEKIDFNFNDKYCVIFPFSNGKERIYKTECFAKICDYLYSKYGLISYIVGSKADNKIANEIIEYSNSNSIKNICGKYKLNEVFYIFNKAKLIITIDSAGYHIGIAVNDNIVCISSGMSYSRYLNYPKEFVKNKNINIVLPKELEEDIKNNTAKIDYEYYPLYDLQSIEPNDICKLIDSKYNLY